MAYLIDRARALYMAQVVAILSLRQRRIRSRTILRDNSLYHSLTRTSTLIHRVPSLAAASIVGEAARTKRKGALWWVP